MILSQRLRFNGSIRSGINDRGSMGQDQGIEPGPVLTQRVGAGVVSLVVCQEGLDQGRDGHEDAPAVCGGLSGYPNRAKSP